MIGIILVPNGNKVAYWLLTLAMFAFLTWVVLDNG